MKQAHLINHFNGPTVVWVDDRFLLSPEQREALISDGAKASKLQSMDDGWLAAVQTENEGQIDDLAEDDLISFARAAIRLKAVCKGRKCNLVLADFKTAHQNWFRNSNALFLLDIQNLLKPLGDYFKSDDGVINDVNWNWELYGAECVRAYQIPRQRFRFFTRFRNEYAAMIAGLLRTYFEDSTEAELWAIRHNLLEELDKRFSAFIDGNQIHADPSIVDLLGWFRRLGLGSSGEGDDHQSLAEGRCLGLARARFGNAFQGESAKALFLGGVRQRSNKDVRHTPIKVSDIGAVFESLDVTVVMNGIDTVRLPCAPALPFVLALKALLFEMRRCKKYFPPDQITLGALFNDSNTVTYVLSFVLRETNKAGDTVAMKQFEKSYSEYVQAGRQRDEQHMTRQRISDLTLWKLTLNDQTPEMARVIQSTLGCHHPNLLNGLNEQVLDGPKFLVAPHRIEFRWTVNSPL